MRKLGANRLRSICRDIGDDYFEVAIGFDGRGRQLFRTVGDSNQCFLTDDETANLHGGTLIHNHPGGGTFSTLDLIFGLAYGLSQLYAIGRRHVYRLDLSQVSYGFVMECPGWATFDRRVNSVPPVANLVLEAYEQAWPEFAAGFGAVYEVEERRY